MNALAAGSKSDPGFADLWSLAPHRPAPRDTRRLLVAIAASADGRVAGSFEEAEEFLLFEKTAQQTCFVGRQPCPFASLKQDHGHRARLFQDCDLVICSGIGDSCRQTLSALGVACELAYAGAAVGEAMSAL